MPGVIRATLLLVFWLGVPASVSAQTAVKNVRDFDPALLAGKTCYETFSNGRDCPNCVGAAVVRFSVRDELLIEHFWRSYGADVYRRMTAVVADPNTLPDLAGFRDYGEDTLLTVVGNAIHGQRADRYSWDGTYQPGGRIFGSNSLGASFTGICRPTPSP